MNFIKENNGLLKLPTNLLGIFAHEDDEVAGAGGTLIKNVQLGGKSHVICFGGSISIRAQEFMNACNKMGVTCELLGIEEGHYGDNLQKTSLLIKDNIIKYKPEFVITHRKDGDYHRDHRVVSELVREAVLKAQTPGEGHMAKGLLFTETHFPHQNWHVMVDVTEQFEIVLDVFRCHESQILKNNGYYLKMLDVRTKFRGVQAGCERAEAFIFEPLTLVGSMNRRNLGV